MRKRKRGKVRKPTRDVKEQSIGENPVLYNALYRWVLNRVQDPAQASKIMEEIDTSLTYQEAKNEINERYHLESQYDTSEPFWEQDKIRWEAEQMGSVIAERGAVKARVVALCRKSPEYAKALQRLVAFERTIEGDPQHRWGGSIGWLWSEAGIAPSLLGVLVTKGIVTKVYETNRYKVFRLTDRDATEEALALYESEKARKRPDKPKRPAVVLSAKDIEELEAICKSVDPLEYFSKLIEPTIRGLDVVKKSILVSLASMDDVWHDRQRVHVLLVGKPGTAKTRLLKFVAFDLGLADYVTNETTDVGLVGDARFGEIVAGVLPMNDGRAVCIDELDKFNGCDQVGLLESMEIGTVTIYKGAHRARLQARVRALAGANIKGKIIAPLLDRFDFVWEFDVPKKEQLQEIMTYRISHWGLSRPTEVELLQKFLEWIKPFKPKFTPVERERAKELVLRFIRLNPNEWGVRQYERLIRIALTIAKIRRRDVRVRDFLDAIKLVNPKLPYSVIDTLETFVSEVEGS